MNNYKTLNNESVRLDSTSKSSYLNTGRGEYTKVSYFRCKHNMQNEKTRDVKTILSTKTNARFSNTNCEFHMVAIEICQKQENLNHNHVVIEWNHNHSTTSLQSKTFKDIPLKIKEKVKELLTADLLPSVVHKEIMRQLRSECTDNLEYQEKLASIPCIPDINSLW